MNNIFKNQGTKCDIARMLSLNERMETSHTKREAIINEENHLNGNNNLNEAATGERQVESPEKIFDILNDIRRNSFICVGTVAAANLKLPTVKRKNPDTNRTKTYDDYETFSKEIGSEDNIAALVNISSYNFRYYPLNDVQAAYGRYKDAFDEIRKGYGLEPTQKKENDYHDTMNYANGISAYKGDNEEKKGNFYVAFNGYNIKPKSITYAVNDEGHIVQELTKEQILPYLEKKDPYAKYSGVAALRKMGRQEQEIEEYVRKIDALKFSYKNFRGNSILWIAATVNGQRIVYINDNLTQSINGINVDKQDFIDKARERYIADMKDMPEY